MRMECKNLSKTIFQVFLYLILTQRITTELAYTIPLKDGYKQAKKNLQERMV